MKVSLEKLVEKIKSLLKTVVYSFISQGLFGVLLLFVILLIPSLLNREYEFLLKVAEFAIIGSGTLAILTFTYAIAIRNDDKNKYDDIILSGEHFLKSTLTFILGLGFMPVVGLMLTTSNPISKYFGMFSAYNDTLGYVVAVIILVIGESSLIASAYFLSNGIVKLIDVLKLVER